MEFFSSNGYKILISDEDVELTKFSWYAKLDSKGQRYADRGANFSTRLLHRVITNCPKGLTVDHVNLNTLDNRKENLRICTAAENNRNKGKKKGKHSSKYVGVSWAKEMKKWYASLKHSGKSYNLGYFSEETEAAKAYDKKAKELYGVFAKPNFKESEG